MSSVVKKMNWGVEQRLEFIEFQLFWEGGVNRADIIDQFGVSVPQASKDLSHYQQLAPKNAWYDKSAKQYRTTDSFKPLFLEPSPDSYLSLLVSNEESAQPRNSWLAHPPEHDRIVALTRNVNDEVLRKIVSGMRDAIPVEILYQSLNALSPEARWRAIFPHAFGHDGLRWHVRAYCYEEEKYKDFILSRASEVRFHPTFLPPAAEDTLWSELFSITLVPNPKLSHAQQAIVSKDYGMLEGRLNLTVRRAMLYYFWKRFRFDVADLLDNPQEVPVVIDNRKSFDKALSEAMS